MSFLTGTNTELIYTSMGVGVAKSAFTSETTLNDTATMGVQAHLPADFWLPTKASAGRGIRIVARGILSSTGTPTYTFSCRFGSAANTTLAIVLGSAALTTITGAANNIWEFEGEVIMESVGAAGTNSTVRGVGLFNSSGTANKIDPLYGGGASPGTVATVDTTITNFINFNVTCSANSASNSITLQQLLVFGLN